MEKFVINNTSKPNSDFKVESRVLDFSIMNKVLNIDPKKPLIKPTKNLNDSYNPISLEELRLRLKSFQEHDINTEKEALYSFGVSEVLPGEYITEKYEGEVLIMNSRCNGLILLTNYRLLVLPINDKFLRSLKLKASFLSIPYLVIEKLTRTLDRKQTPPFALFELETKDSRELSLKFIIDEDLTIENQEKVFIFLQNSINPQFPELYALQLGLLLKKLDLLYKGWVLYDLEGEFLRQGIHLNEPDSLYRYFDNTQGKLCSTYPDKIIVPSKVTDEILYKTAGFRSRGRLPVLTYLQKNPLQKVGLWRSSQSLPGFSTNRCLEDEAMLRAIGIGTKDGFMVKIYDARPYLSAVANKMNGKGYENRSFYSNTDIKFLEIGNIHKVRDAYRKVCNERPDFMPWLETLGRLLKGTEEICGSLKEGINVLVHCSDGWDRTSQLISLAQVVLDPYFRTIEGFFVLIEKDWVAFGHQFALRAGHGNFIKFYGGFIGFFFLI